MLKGSILNQNLSMYLIYKLAKYCDESYCDNAMHFMTLVVCMFICWRFCVCVFSNDKSCAM